MQTEEILIPITLFVSIAVVLYNFVKTRHAERMAIIEKGLNEDQLKYLLNTKKKEVSLDSWSLKFGAILVGVGIAVIIGSLVPYDIQDEITVGSIFLLPGIGLMLVYKYTYDKIEKNKE